MSLNVDKKSFSFPLNYSFENNVPKNGVLENELPLANFVGNPSEVSIGRMLGNLIGGMIFHGIPELIRTKLQIFRDPTHLSEIQLKILKVLTQGPMRPRQIIENLNNDCPHIALNFSTNIQSLWERKFVDRTVHIEKKEGGEHKFNVYSLTGAGRNALDKALRPVVVSRPGPFAPAFRMSPLHHSYSKLHPAFFGKRMKVL